MGRTVGKILTIAGGAVLIGLTAGALGVFGGAFVAGTAATATAAATTATLFGISTSTLLLVSAGATLLGGLLNPPRFSPESFAAEQGTLLNLNANRDSPRLILYGRAATGGDLVYQEALGTDNVDLYTVIALAGHECESIDEFHWDDTEITFSSNNAVGNFNNKMFLFEHLGAENQTVDTTLDAASTKWTSNHRLQGICYIVLKLVYDAEKFQQGFQKVKVILKGRKIYDPRLDSTNGGSGSQRLNNQSTWVHSANPALCIADYLRGIRMVNSSSTSYDGQIIAGMNIADGLGQANQTAIAAASNIDWANIAEQADVCDESQALKAGGSENKYECNGYVNPTASHNANIKALSTSMGGTVLVQGGQWRVFAADARAAVKSRGQDDIIGTLNYRSKKPIEARINAVRGTIADVANDYELTPLPSLINSTFKTQDGGQELWHESALPFTTSNPMGQRLMKIRLERSRMEKTIACAMMPSVLTDTVMDNIFFTYAPFNLDAQKMTVSSWTLRFMRQDKAIASFVEYEAIEENDAIYAWVPAIDEQTPVGRELQKRVDINPANLGDLTGNLDNVSDSATRFAADELNSNNTESRTADDVSNLAEFAIENFLDGDSGRLKNLFRMPQTRVQGPGSTNAANPLTAADVGSDTTITIGAHTNFVGDATGVLYSAGSVTGLAFSTKFQIFADDPNFAGGTVTYVATTNLTDTTKANGRYWVGEITTPADGGGGTGGEGGGGGGTGGPLP